MRCLQCGKKLNLLRKIANGEFCSAEHREQYRSNESALGLMRLRESQVRIERRPAPSAKALAAVERLRAMDASDADPEFVETVAIVECVRPRNQRLMAAVPLSPMAVRATEALPERPSRRRTLCCRPAEDMQQVEATPLRVPLVVLAAALRPVFRLSMRLPKPGLRQCVEQRGAAGLAALKPSAGEGPGAGLAEGGARAGSKPGGLVANDGREELIPAPKRELQVDPPMRQAKRSAKLRMLGLADEVELRPQAEAAPAVPESGRDLLPAEWTQALKRSHASLRSSTAGRTAEHGLAAGGRLETLKVDATGGRSVIAVSAAALTPDSAGAMPESGSPPAARVRPAPAMEPLMVRPVKGDRRELPIDSSPALARMAPALPAVGALHLAPAFLSLGGGWGGLLTIPMPAAIGGAICVHALEAAPARHLAIALPPRHDIHTTRPQMSEAPDMRPLQPPGQAVRAQVRVSAFPALARAAAANSPALPGLAFWPEPVEAAPPSPEPRLAVTPIMPGPDTEALEPMPPAGEGPLSRADLAGVPPEWDTTPDEPEPPALERQLPLAIGRAMRDPMQRREAGSGGENTLWDGAISSAALAPRTKLKLDHADGSGSRQRRATARAFRGRFLPTIDMRRMPGRKFWTYAPADLKWVALGLPLILIFVVYSFRGGQPNLGLGAAAATRQAAPAEPAADSRSIGHRLKQILTNRAAINLLDDFRGGLGAWQGKEDWAKSWHYGQATFLEPGSLAFYQPSMGLRDYSLEFLGQIQDRSLNWVFRAKDAGNYYAMRIVVSGPGPAGRAQIVQYAVIDGKQERPKVMPTPYPVRTDTMYLVRMEVRGGDFHAYLQGQPLYSFSDDRLKEGGIGFFGPRGDKSYLRWVQVKHQFDYIGRLCALLAPYQAPPEAAGAE